MNYTLLIAFLFCWISSTPVLAQPAHYQFIHLDVNKGLSDNQVNCILKDSRGFMWFGTRSGLNRYDGYTFKVFKHNARDTTSLSANTVNRLFNAPEGKMWVRTSQSLAIYDPTTERFERDATQYLRKFGLPDDSVEEVVKDKKGNYWFTLVNSGVYYYQTASKKTIKITHVAQDTTTIGPDRVCSLQEDSHGTIWLIHEGGLLEALHPTSHKVIYRTNFLTTRTNKPGLRYRIFLDADNDLWIYPRYNFNGVFYFNQQTKTFLPIQKDSEKIRLNTNLVWEVAQDSKGLIWVGTDHGGINLIDKKTWTVRYILQNQNDSKSLSHNSIYSLYRDNSGIMWAGTYKKGINYYHENIIKFGLYQHQASNPTSLSHDDINCFAEDAKGNLWLGANGGGLIYFDRATGKFSQYLNNPLNSNSLSNNIIVSLMIDKNQQVWAGTYFGGLNRFDGSTFTHYRNDPANPNSIGDDRIWELFEDSQKRFWIGTFENGLSLFNRERNTFSHFRVGDPNSIHSNYISTIIEDREGNLWVGTSYGLEKLSRKTGQFEYYSTSTSNLSHNNILSLREDSRGWLWVGTTEGLNLLNKKQNTFRHFSTEDGLPDNSIQTIIEDNNGNLWMSTPNGLSNLVIHQAGKGQKYTFTVKNYDESDGLQGKEFSESAAYKTSKGELIFGGANGFNIFRPEDITINKQIPALVLTDFQVFNTSVKVGEELDGKVMLNKSISELQEITLQPGQNVFTIEFAALSYFHPEKNQYVYMLDGFNKEWLKTDATTRKATYTNLDPGTYTFRVKASNNDGVWNEKGISLKIIVLPPFWKTKFAFLLYAFFIVGALLLSRWLIRERERLSYHIEQERRESHRMHELDMMKIKFFTNVSHEFRTPLTLIITPIEKILKNTKDTEQKNQILLIYRNARRLLNLVNQLLDFRRLEVQEIRLNPSQGDLIKFINEISYSFSDLSEKKNIRFSFNSNISTLETFFDQDKIERIMFNLLSNAFKFTPENGSVSVEVNLEKSEEIADLGAEWLQIAVKDSGIGIPSEKHEKIFERFFQNDTPGTMVNQGSGIGLSITKEFVKLHEGTITLNSEPEKGSCFIVRLPIRRTTDNLVLYPVADVQPAEPSTLLVDMEQEPPITKNESKKPLVLLVEDNEDFRFYLKDNLKENYQIIEARNGVEGWQNILSLVPDLVVSDVMMPEMDGIQLCKKIKTDARTSHIPVILLTARAAEEQKMEGFETGANDYITKPFNFELLQSRIKNLITQRESIKKVFHKQIEINPSEIAITSLDEKLIQKTLALVEKNIANPDFSVEELSRELGMSRVYLYKKLLSLTGKTPIEFIRIVRLRRAVQLLEKSQLSVSEIAYQVGFNNPKYFTKYFKTEFNVLPSAYVSEKRKAGK